LDAGDCAICGGMREYPEISYASEIKPEIKEEPEVKIEEENDVKIEEPKIEPKIEQ